MKQSPPQGFSNQQALLVLVLVFPLGLIGLGLILSVGLNRPQTSVGDIEPTVKTPSAAPAPRIDPELRQRQQSGSTAQRQDPIDAVADEIFWRRHPSLRGLKLTNQQGELAKEWGEIRRCDAIVDYRFYERFPHMRGQTIEADDTAMIRIWTSLRDQIPGCS